MFFILACKCGFFLWKGVDVRELGMDNAYYLISAKFSWLAETK